MIVVFFGNNFFVKFLDFFVQHLFSWYGILIVAIVFVAIVFLFYRIFFKRFFDILFSLIGLVVCFAFFCVIALLIKLTSKGPVFFLQKRVGKDKKIFYMYKFRTMSTNAPQDKATHLLENPTQYITPFGSFLRKFSLDELPQLINILLGQMSIVGPRPALYNQYDLILLRDKHNANNTRPGLTGLAQISGRDELEISQKAKIDGEYCENITLAKDIAIIWKTISKVLTHENIKEGTQN